VNAGANANVNPGANANAGGNASAGATANRWRYQQHNGEWWYWTPQNNWMYYRNGAWAPYDAATFVFPRGYGAGQYYYGRYGQPWVNYGMGYAPGYDGYRYGVGYRGYGNGIYNGNGGYGYGGYVDPGVRAGANIGGAVGGAIGGGGSGGNVGRAVGGAIGGALGGRF
jgi:hypothetical protein